MSAHKRPYELKQASYEVSDPGSGAAINYSKWGQVVPFTIAASASETNTLAAPLNANQRITMFAQSVGSGGSRVVTVASAINADGDTTLTFDAVDEWCTLTSVPVGSGTFEWRYEDGEGVTGGVADAQFDSIVVDAAATINESGAASGDFRVESDTITNMLRIDADGCLNGQLSIGAAPPTNPQAFVAITPPANATGVTANQSYFHITALPGGAVVAPTGTAPIVATMNVAEPNITATGTVTDAATVRIADAPTEGSGNWALWVDAGATRLDGTAYIGDTANANVTLGLTINQAGNDDNILCLKSSDVATGLTSIVTGAVETDDFLAVQKFAAATGGVNILGLGHNAAVTTNFRLESYGGQASTTHTSEGRCLFEVAVHQHDGANALAAITADGNVFGIRCNQGGTETTVWLVDEDGAPQSIIDHAAFDEHDDIALLRGLDVVRTGESPSYGFVKSRFDDYLSHNEQQLVDVGVLGAPLKEGGLLNMKRLAMVQNGAIWQLFEDMMEVVNALPEEVKSKIGGRMQQRLAALPGA